MSSNNKKIGYITGVFDLFHVGHLEIFYFPYTKNISSTSLRSTLKRLIQEEEKDSN